MKAFKVIAITHKKSGLEAVGKFHLDDERAAAFLPKLKKDMNWDELMYLSTCNRTEFYISSKNAVNIPKLLSKFSSNITANDVDEYVGDKAIDHLFRVASSLDSMVVGEREIITQVRLAFDKSKEWGLTGDDMRLAIRKTIEHAKRIFTETAIANNPVSVVSLAFRQMKEADLPKDSKILMIGAGQTNTTMARLLAKAGWNNITVFNRTLSKAQTLADELNLSAKALSDLPNYKEGFDAIVTCTGSEDVIITAELYAQLLGNDEEQKMIVDLAIPEDTDEEILHSHSVHYISVADLKPIAEHNLEQRKSELVQCEVILQESMQEFKAMHNERKVERAMQAVPQKVKEIKSKAVDSVFANELSQLDENSREVLEKVLGYMEKKYISVPMKMAKEIILEKSYNDRKHG